MATANGTVSGGDVQFRGITGTWTANPTGAPIINIEDDDPILYPRGYLVRFTLAVPQGATVNSAAFGLRANNGGNFGGNDAAFALRAIASDNPSIPANYAAWAASSFTSGSPTVGNVSAGQQFSVDAITAIQAIVNRSGWVSGNAIVLSFWGLGGGAGTIDAINTTGRNFTPTLAVDYTAPPVAGGNALLMVL